MNTPFYRESLTRQATVENNSEAITELSELLTSQELASEIQAGNITVAMIRPSLQNSTLEGWADTEAADHIEESIANLGVAAKFAIQFDSDTVDNFYRGQPKDIQENLPAERYSPFKNRWEEFVDLMTSGPTTVMLLHSNNGDAIAKWRNQVGHYDIVNRRDSTNLRGKFGVDNYNNLIHGSDSEESVAREVALLTALLQKDPSDADNSSIERVVKYNASFLGAKTLDILGVDSPSDINILKDWTPSGEVYSTEFTVNRDGKDEHLIAKACVKPLPTATVQEWIQRREEISGAGISVPELKNVSDATIIEEFIPYTFQEAYNLSDDSTKEKMKNLFFEAYQILISQGFLPTSLHDIRSRGSDLVIVDFGEDLGGKLGSAEMTVNDVTQAAKNQFDTIVGLK